MGRPLAAADADAATAGADGAAIWDLTTGRVPCERMAKPPPIVGPVNLGAETGLAVSLVAGGLLAWGRMADGAKTAPPRVIAAAAEGRIMGVL
jgi:hypothetical protein